MSESSENNGRDTATTNFYSKQRGHVGAETAAPMTAFRDESVTNTDAALSSLDAFLLSQEEDAFALLATFTQLTEQDKIRVVSELEDEADPSDTESAAEGVKKATKPVAHYEALRRRLQAQERQRQRDRQMAQQRHVDVKNIGDAAGSSAVADAHADIDDVETVELTDGTHTGNLVAFFDRGVVDVSTSFDNFFAGDSEALAAVVDVTRKANKSTDTFNTAQQSTRVRATALPTLDEILALDDVDEGAIGGSALCEARSGDESSPIVSGEERIEKDAEKGDKDGGLHSTSLSSSSSDLGSVELPGLDDVVVNEPESGNAASSASGANERSVLEIDSEFAAGLRQVVVEPNDCVQTFALDPLFDYDADVLGEAFRTEKAWRQS